VGIDIWTSATEVAPRITVMGVNEGPGSDGNWTKFRFSIEDPLLACNLIGVRGWYTSPTARSSYGPLFKSPGCDGGGIPYSQLIPLAKGYNLSSQSALFSLASERMSNANIGTYAPTSSNLPPLPSSPRLKVTGNKIQLTVNVGDGKQPVSKVYLLNPDLGFGLDNFLSATLIKNQAIFEFALTSENAGSTTNAEIYSANSYGTSQPLILPISLPKLSQGNGSKPEPPSGLKINFLSDRVDVNVNLPANDLVKATGAYLIAPLLGFTKSTPLFAKIDGLKATFTIALTNLVLGKSSGLQIFSTNENGDSDPLDGFVALPKLSPVSGKAQGPVASVSSETKNSGTSTQVPSKPIDPKYKLSGSNVFITVSIPPKTNAAATGAFLIAPGIGFTKESALVGTVNKNIATFLMPIQESMAGKVTQVEVYASNKAGLSIPLAGKVTIPLSLKTIASESNSKVAKTAPLPAAKSPATSQGNSTLSATSQRAKPKTIKCYKGKTERVFVSENCPAGWTNKR
jgi:hypothetical protein